MRSFPTYHGSYRCSMLAYFWCVHWPLSTIQMVWIWTLVQSFFSSFNIFKYNGVTAWPAELAAWDTIHEIDLLEHFNSSTMIQNGSKLYSREANMVWSIAYWLPRCFGLVWFILYGVPWYLLQSSYHSKQKYDSIDLYYDTIMWYYHLCFKFWQSLQCNKEESISVDMKT